MILDNNQEAFLALVRAGLFPVIGEGFLDEPSGRAERMVKGFPLSIGDDVDWNKVLDLAEEQSVIGLVAAGIEAVQGEWLKVMGTPLVPKSIALQFIGRTVQLEQRNQAMNYFIGVIVEKMRAAGIEAVLVKGQGVAQCYERPLWRSCGDVDLFLSDENYERAKAFLTPLAASVEEEYVREKHLGMTIDPWVVELHGRLYSGLSGSIERELDGVYRDSFAGGNVRSWDNSGVRVPQLAVENDVFYVFTHILQHFYKGGIGLRQICDWCRLLWTYRSELDVAKLEGRLRRAGLMTAWKAFGAFAVEYLGMDAGAVPFFNENDNHNDNLTKKAERIKAFVMMSGNFGHNRDHSYFEKYPYVIRKCVSFGRRCGDLFRHARIFPLDSLRFSFAIMRNGVRSAIRGE